VKDCLERCDMYCKEGSVCFKERFFRSASVKYTAALSLLNHAHKIGGNQSNSASADNNSGTQREGEGNQDSLSDKEIILGELPILRDLRCSCHLNIAACHLQRARDYHQVITHCSQVVNIMSSLSSCPDTKEVDTLKIKSLLRRADGYAKLGQFDAGVSDLRDALQLSVSRGDEESCVADIERRLEKILFKKTQFSNLDTTDET
jgi:hypothetical protein